MSHTTDLGQGWIAIHDGDYRGDVILRQIAPNRKRPLKELTLPVSVLLDFVAEAVRSAAISRLEDATTEELLNGPHASLAARVDRLEREP